MNNLEYRNILYLLDDARLTADEYQELDRMLALWQYATLPDHLAFRVGEIRGRIARERA
jgi:hypothetical protein